MQCQSIFRIARAGRAAHEVNQLARADVMPVDLPYPNRGTSMMKGATPPRHYSSGDDRK
jgi:hypothetical protein